MNLTLLRQYGAALLWRWICAADDQRFVARFELANRWWLRLPISCSYLTDRRCLEVQDAHGMKLAFVNRQMVSRFSQGIDVRLKSLAAEYLATDCGLMNGDFVIDVGANIGEFSRYCSDGFGATVLAIEPESACENALALNLDGCDATIVKEALWSEETDLVIYHSQAANDTTLIEPERYDYSEPIHVVTLDGLLARHEANRGRRVDWIKLIKLEAEGAEPEIIAGGTNALSRTEYVAVDCGPERGLKLESTLVPAINALLAVGFELVGFNPKRTVLLMKNRAARAGREGPHVAIDRKGGAH